MLRLDPFFGLAFKTVILLRVPQTKLVWQYFNDLPNLGRLLFEVHVNVRTACIPGHLRITLDLSAGLVPADPGSSMPGCIIRVETEESEAAGGGRRRHLPGANENARAGQTVRALVA